MAQRTAQQISIRIPKVLDFMPYFMGCAWLGIISVNKNLPRLVVKIHWVKEERQKKISNCKIQLELP